MLLLTGFLQLGVVVINGSVRLLADTIHNFADALTSVPLLASRSGTNIYVADHWTATEETV